MSPPVSALAWLAVGAIVGCNGDPPAIALTRIVPEVEPNCGVSDDGTTLFVSALGDFSASSANTISRPIQNTGAVSIDAFPADTRVLVLEVRGERGVHVLGKTAPLSFGELREGERIPVFTAPPDDLCPTGAPLFARADPMLARAGRFVLVAGGDDPDDSSVYPIERYDTAAGTFVADPVDHYGDDGAHKLFGASLTSVRPRIFTSEAGDTVDAIDAQVGITSAPTHAVLAGGLPAFQIYDALADTWTAPLLMQPERAYHAAVALDDRRVLLAGGCYPLIDGHICEPRSSVVTSTIIDATTSDYVQGPDLTLPRIGGLAMRESARSVLLVGGFDDQGLPVTRIERLWLDGTDSQLFDGSASALAPLVSGSALLAFPPPGASGSTPASVVPPLHSGLSPVANPPWASTSATLTPLQDGRVLAIAETAGPRVTRTSVAMYEPSRASFTPLDIRATGSLPGRGHAAVRLADGSVLVVGGRPSGQPTNAPQRAAWVFRPGSIGPFASALTVTFDDDDRVEHLVPRDPANLNRVPRDGVIPAHIDMLASAGDSALPAEWAIVAGPVLTRGELSARVRSRGGGVALLVGFRGPDDYLAVVSRPGQLVVVYAVERGAARTVASCTGAVIGDGQLAPADPAASVDIALTFDTSALSMTLNGASVLDCEVDSGVPTGMVGVGVVGAAGDRIRVDLLSITR